MMVVRDVARVMDSIAPPSFAMDKDRIGLQVGRFDRPVRKLMVALEPSPNVIHEAIAKECDMLVTHHALIYHPLTSINTSTARGQALARALSCDLAIFVAHTNLDVAVGGVNDVLAKLLKLRSVQILDPFSREIPGTLDEYGIGRVGNLPEPLPLYEMAEMVRASLQLTAVRYAGDADHVVQRIAILGGAGSGWVNKARDVGADVLVTADCDHHTAAEAWQDGLAVIDATHAGLEKPAMASLAVRLQGLIAEVEVVLAESTEDPFHWCAERVIST